MRFFPIILICLLLPLIVSGQELVQHPYDAFPQWRETPASKQHTKRMILQMKHETLENAINLLSQKFEVSIATGVSKLPDKKVTIAQKAYTLEEVLLQVLLNTPLEPVFLPTSQRHHAFLAQCL